MDIIDFIRECYEEHPSTITFTLKRLNNNPEFKKTIEKLRSEGWLDWQLLGAIKSITLAYRVRFAPQHLRTIEELKEYLREKSKTPELETDPIVPLSEFTHDKLQYTLINGRDNLMKRYNFDKEDVIHEPIFFI